MSYKLSNIAAASFLPGLQNTGTISGTAYVTGFLPASPNYPTTTSNLTGTFTVPLIDISMISLLRVNLPDANGDLASSWFPVMGTAELHDDTADWLLILYVLSDPVGRSVSFNFVNKHNAGTTLTNFRINIYAHLFSYPWSQWQLRFNGVLSDKCRLYPNNTVSGVAPLVGTLLPFRSSPSTPLQVRLTGTVS